jgi:hypothetical protein
MAVIRSIPIRKYINGHEVTTSEVALISDEFYSTKGEDILIIRQTTDRIKIKVLNNVLIIPDKGKIDEEWDELSISKGACVELRFAGGSWYIMSSDGIKFD